MPRDIFTNGETMITVKGSSSAPLISTLQQLGLAASQVRISFDFKHEDVNANAWGKEPFEIQFMLSEARITMDLIHFDMPVVQDCLRESMGGAAAQAVEGTTPRAGSRLGNNSARFSATNHFVGLNISSPVGGAGIAGNVLPWRFYFAYLTGPPMEIPLGTEKSIVQLNWRAIPYTTDPWGGGSGAQGNVWFDHTADQ